MCGLGGLCVLLDRAELTAGLLTPGTVLLPHTLRGMDLTFTLCFGASAHSWGQEG